MRTGIAILLAPLLLAGCGDAKRQQSAGADIPFDTREETRSGPVGRAEITAIDAALGDAAEMPAESAMAPPAPPPGAAPTTVSKPAPPPPDPAPAAATPSAAGLS